MGEESDMDQVRVGHEGKCTDETVKILFVTLQLCESGIVHVHVGNRENRRGCYPIDVCPSVESSNHLILPKNGLSVMSFGGQKHGFWKVTGGS
jgi:hypothetical protein